MRERPIASLASISAARAAAFREYLSTLDISSPDHALDTVFHAHGGWFSFQGGCSRDAFHAACLALALATASAPLGPCVIGEAGACLGLAISASYSAAFREYLSTLDVSSPAQALDTVFHVYDGRFSFHGGCSRLAWYAACLALAFATATCAGVIGESGERPMPRGMSGARPMPRETELPENQPRAPSRKLPSRRMGRPAPACGALEAPHAAHASMPGCDCSWFLSRAASARAFARACMGVPSPSERKCPRPEDSEGFVGRPGRN